MNTYDKASQHYVGLSNKARFHKGYMADKLKDKEMQAQLPAKFRNAGVGEDMAEEKIKGVDGKACWKGKRYAGTKNGKDVCVPVGEDTYINHLMAALESKK